MRHLDEDEELDRMLTDPNFLRRYRLEVLKYIKEEYFADAFYFDGLPFADDFCVMDSTGRDLGPLSEEDRQDIHDAAEDIAIRAWRGFPGPIRSFRLFWVKRILFHRR